MESLHIWDFPDGMYVKLPSEYRHIFFQLAFLELGGTHKSQQMLRENNLTTNVIRWKTGKDRGCDQLIELKSLLFLRSYAESKRNKLYDLYKKVKNRTDFSLKRIEKTSELIFLIRELRYIFNGNLNISNLLCIKPGALRSYTNRGEIKKIPIKLVFNLFTLIDDVFKFAFSLEELENKILSYRAHHGKKIIPEFDGERKLPIKITPEFESILYHLFGDGYVPEIGSGEYTQLNAISKNNFLKKLFRVFGHFEFSEKGFNNGRIYLSRTILKIICHYYGLTSDEFKWNKSVFPKICFRRENSFKLAGLLAFTVDEAHIGRSVITIHSSNKDMLSQIRQIVLDLDYPCSQISLKKGRGTTKDSFRFNIFKRGVKKLLSESKALEKMYPTCNLAQKKEKVLAIFN